MAVCACSGFPAGLAAIVALPAVLIAAVVVGHRAAAPSPQSARAGKTSAAVAAHSASVRGRAQARAR